MKKKEVKPAEITPPVEVKPPQEAVSPADKPVEKPPEVRLEAVEVQTTAPLAEPQVKTPELGASIDNLAKIVDSSSSMPLPQQESLQPVTRESKQGYLWLAVSFLAGLGMGIGVGYLVWGKAVIPASLKTPVVNAVPTQAPAAVVVPTTAPPAATPTAANLQKSTLKVEVLNGNGGKGVAAKAKDILTAAGYTNVAAGNAERDDFAQTEIAIKASKNAYLDGLKKDLADKYTLSDKATVLAESDKYDVIITIGLK